MTRLGAERAAAGLPLAAVLGLGGIAIVATGSQASAPEYLDAWSGAVGILTPAVSLLGVRACSLTLGWLAFSLLVTGLARPREPLPAPLIRPLGRPRAGLVLMGVFAITASLARIAVAASCELESDEFHPYAGHQALFDSSHDAWLHPPLFRAIQLYWLSLLPHGASTLLYRAPAVLFGASALFALLATLHSLGLPARAVVGATAALAFGPEIVYASSIARPYSLGLLLTAVVVDGKTRGGSQIPAVAAAGLAMWVDIVYGAALLLLLMVPLPGQRLSTRQLGHGALAALWALPLLPGALQAALHPVLPHHGTAMDPVAIGQLAESGLGRGNAVRLALELLAVTAIGTSEALLGAGFLAATLWLRRKRGWASAGRSFAWRAFLVAAPFALSIGTHRSLRARNVLFLAVLWAVVLAVSTVQRTGAKQASRT